MPPIMAALLGDVDKPSPAPLRTRPTTRMNRSFSKNAITSKPPVARANPANIIGLAPVRSAARPASGAATPMDRGIANRMCPA